MSTPSFQFYPKQLIGDDNYQLMDWDARGMHVHLMCICWQQAPACTIPDDDHKLCKWLGVSDADDWLLRLKPQIFQAWKKEGERWLQDGLRREYLKQKEMSAKRRAAANKRWQAKDKQTKINDEKPDANAMHLVCPSSSSSTSTSLKTINHMIIDNCNALALPKDKNHCPSTQSEWSQILSRLRNYPFEQVATPKTYAMFNHWIEQQVTVGDLLQANDLVQVKKGEELVKPMYFDWVIKGILETRGGGANENGTTNPRFGAAAIAAVDRACALTEQDKAELEEWVDPSAS